MNGGNDMFKWIFELRRLKECETGQTEFFIPFIHMEMILGSIAHQCLSEAISFPDNVANQPHMYNTRGLILGRSVCVIFGSSTYIFGSKLRPKPVLYEA